MSGDMMPKQQYDFIKGIQDNMLEASNMTEDDAWRFGFLIWQHQEWIYKYLIDRKTENSSEIPNNCEELNAYRECVKSRSFWDSKHCDGCYFDEKCPFDEPKDEPTISKMEQVDKDINVRSKDCETCKHYKLACELFSEICKYEPTTQTETQNSNLTFEKRTMRDCYNCKRYETEGECVECHYEPKDEPQTGEHCNTCRHKDECEGATYEYKNTEWWCLAYAPIEDEPQTERSE